MVCAGPEKKCVALFDLGLTTFAFYLVMSVN
jgi:hypothetical protein